MYSKWLLTLSLWPLWLLSGCVALLSACAERDPATSDLHDTGTLTLSLAATSQGRNYRLRQASFDISGPTHAVLDGEQDPDAPALTTQLEAGSYQISLNGLWFLERLDATGPVRLTASLMSDNPLPVEIGSGVTSSVVFRFATDGTIVTLGAGQLSIGTEVVDTSASNLPPGLSVLAGQPSGWGFADGVGAPVRFGSLYAITTDGEGSLFVGDGNFIRRVVLATGEVTTLSANLGSASMCPTAMVVVAGSLYFSNCDCTIHQIALASGEVTLVGGSPGERGEVDGTASEARFDFPSGIAADSAGNLYVSEVYTGVIRKLVLATGQVTTLAGSPDELGTIDGVGRDARFASPGDLTFNGDGNLYVADSIAIRQIDLASGHVTTLAGGTSGTEGIADGTGSDARFNGINFITSDELGNLYVSEFDTLRRVAIATAEVTTFAGRAGEYGFADGVGSDARFSGASGIVHVDGRLYLAENESRAIRTVSLDESVVSTFVGSPPRVGNQDGVGPAVTFGNPQAAVGDGQGNLYVTDPTMHTIRKIAIASGLTTTLAGQPGESGSVDGIGNAARFVTPSGITRDARGNLYVTDSNDYTIRKIVPNTAEVTTFAGRSGFSGDSNGVGAAATFLWPSAITSDGADNLYVADWSGGLIRKIAISTGRVTTVPAQGGLPAQGLASDRAGNLYLSDAWGSVQKFVLATGETLPVAGSDQLGYADGVGGEALFQFPTALAFDGAGQLFVVDNGNLIRKIVLATGTVSTVVGVHGLFQGVLPGPLPARLNSPTGIEVLPGGLAILDEGAVLTAGF